MPHSGYLCSLIPSVLPTMSVSTLRLLSFSFHINERTLDTEKGKVESEKHDKKDLCLRSGFRSL
ncbi:unnamed protein product [Camellia sinensis]